MAWRIEYAETARRSLKKLDRRAAKRIVDHMASRIATADNPRLQGKALTGSFAGAWRYRVGNYRVICKIRDDILCILVVEAGHRGDVYR